MGEVKVKLKRLLGHEYFLALEVYYLHLSPYIHIHYVQSSTYLIGRF